MWKLLFLAGIGGFVGSCCRFLVNRLFLVTWKSTFPLATFSVNILGCLIFGILFGLLNRNGVVPPKLYSLLMVGFCGGFTTFSSFSFESFNLVSYGEIITSVLYMALSVVCGFLAIWIGLLITR